MTEGEIIFFFFQEEDGIRDIGVTGVQTCALPIPAMPGAQYRLDNLTAIIDVNRVSQSGHVHEIMGVEPLADKWRAFGWQVKEFDGHDMGEVVDTFDNLPLTKGKPNALLDRKSTRLNSSHANISYAVFCL